MGTAKLALFVMILALALGAVTAGMLPRPPRNPPPVPVVHAAQEQGGCILPLLVATVATLLTVLLIIAIYP